MANGVKDRLEEILNKREYQIYYEDTRGIWQRIKDWFQEQIAKILQKIFPALESTTSIAGVIVTIIVVVAVIILGIILYRVSRNMKLKRKYQQSSPLQDLHEMDWTYKNHFEMAERREAEGEYEQAVRHLFLGLLLYYHEIKWVEAQIWKTNWEYYAELKVINNQGAESFDKLALLFDHVAYGKRNITADQYKEYHNEIMQSYKRAKDLVTGEEEE